MQILYSRQSRVKWQSSKNIEKGYTFLLRGGGGGGGVSGLFAVMSDQELPAASTRKAITVT